MLDTTCVVMMDTTFYYVFNAILNYVVNAILTYCKIMKYWESMKIMEIHEYS